MATKKTTPRKPRPKRRDTQPGPIAAGDRAVEALAAATTMDRIERALGRAADWLVEYCDRDGAEPAIVLGAVRVLGPYYMDERAIVAPIREARKTRDGGPSSSGEDSGT